MSETLGRVLEEVKALSPEEQRLLRDQLEVIVNQEDDLSSRAALIRALYEEGLIQEIKPKPVDLKKLVSVTSFL